MECWVGLLLYLRKKWLHAGWMESGLARLFSSAAWLVFVLLLLLWMEKETLVHSIYPLVNYNNNHRQTLECQPASTVIMVMLLLTHRAIDQSVYAPKWHIKFPIMKHCWTAIIDRWWSYISIQFISGIPRTTIVYSFQSASSCWSCDNSPTPFPHPASKLCRYMYVGVDRRFAWEKLSDRPFVLLLCTPEEFCLP